MSNTPAQSVSTGTNFVPPSYSTTPATTAGYFKFLKKFRLADFPKKLSLFQDLSFPSMHPLKRFQFPIYRPPPHPFPLNSSFKTFPVPYIPPPPPPILSPSMHPNKRLELPTNPSISKFDPALDDLSRGQTLQGHVLQRGHDARRPSLCR